MLLVGLLFLGIALLPVLVVLAAALCAVRLLCLMAADALANTPAPRAGRSRSTRRVAGSRLIGVEVTA